MSGAVSRRRLLGAAGGTALVAGLAGCGATGASHAPAKPEESADKAAGDVVLLRGLVAAQLRVAAPPTRSPVLRAIPPRQRRHLLQLEAQIRRLGGRIPVRVISSGTVRSPRVVAAQTEQLIATYVDVLPKLESAKAQVAVAEILTGEAEHLAVLHHTLGLPAVGTPFLPGRQPA